NEGGASKVGAEEARPAIPQKAVSVQSVSSSQPIPLPAAAATKISVPTTISVPTAMPQMRATPTPIPARTDAAEHSSYAAHGERSMASKMAEELPAIIDIESATMSQLIRHPFTQGKLSSKELSRIQEQKERRSAKLGSQLPGSAALDSPILPDPSASSKRSMPKLILVNGEMVVDRQSLQIAAEEQVNEDAVFIEEDASSRYVTSFSFRNRVKLVAPKWSDAMTARFYDGLSYFGTDFKLISYMFPGMTHRHIKLKHKAEEVKNAAKITEYLRNRRKPPQDLKEKMLASVKAKQTLEDSQYVNKRKDHYGGNDDDSRHIKADTKDTALDTDTKEGVDVPKPELNMDLGVPTPATRVRRPSNAILAETTQFQPDSLAPIRSQVPVTGPVKKVKRKRGTKVSFEDDSPVPMEEGQDE
ncbi:Transcription factor TFIIIB component B, partial [Kappamyces sp. JEL0829]